MSTLPSITHLIVRLDTGGAETSLLRLIAGTRTRLAHHVICFGPPSPLGRKIENLGVKVSWLDYRRSGPLVLWQALRLLRQQPPDILQGWMYYGNVLASLLGWWTKRTTSAQPKVAWNVRNAILEPAKDNWMIRGALMCARLCSPDLVIYNSFAGQQAHSAMRKQPRQLVIPNGIDLNEYAPDENVRKAVRARYQTGCEIWAGVVSRFHEGKGINEYLQAVKLLKSREVPVRLFLAGNGMTLENPELATLLSKLALAPDALELLGPIENVAGFLPAVDLLIQPSLREGTPNILLEAMACGVNTVATAAGDTARIVQDPTRLATPGNIEELAEKIANAIGESEDTRAARVQRERAFLTAQYSASRCMQSYLAAYAAIIGVKEQELMQP
ncbi:MAG: glycosyltransferase [bacterium]